MQLISRGDRGLPVADVQKRLHELGYSPPGMEIEMRESSFGEATEAAIREFQAARGLRPDGRVDEVTWRELVEASFRLGDRFLYLRVPPFRGDDVRELQAYLNRLGFNAGREDGIFGQETDKALRAFQHDMGLPVDGIAGTSTISCLLRLKHGMKETSVAVVHETLRDGEDRGLKERLVVLDLDPGQPELVEVLRSASEALKRMGIISIYTGGPESPDSESRRALKANQEGADAVLGFRPGDTDRFHVFFFGSGQYLSPRGRRLAELVACGLEKGLGLPVSPPAPRSYPLLRETRMPCVVVEWPPRREIPPGLGPALARALADYFSPPEEEGGNS
ncbi:peptidoglycan-binding protein [Candidatus Solincola tengchongensis]|uniref:peptidoglycan-binding protein n=1 Tax=Candidatus Solincola tengchongensis TaxID=2900693 RepID=UPI00257E88B0